MIHDPKLLVLDEPLSGIDPIGRRELLDLFLSLAEQGKCLLVSSHELDELEKLTDHVAIMARGRIAAVGTLARIRDLLDDHPLAVRIDSDRPRELAELLLGLDDVVGVEIGDGNLGDRARAAIPGGSFARSPGSCSKTMSRSNTWSRSTTRPTRSSGICSARATDKVRFGDTVIR